jgi:cell division septum initiation protein DivIVA
VDAITRLTLFKSIADAGKTIAEIAKGVNNYETKQRLNAIYDNLMDLKQQAARLEDENRELKEKLRLASKPMSTPNIRCLGSKIVFLREGLNGSG